MYNNHSLLLKWPQPSEEQLREGKIHKIELHVFDYIDPMLSPQLER